MAQRRVVELLRELSLPLVAGVLTAIVWANLDAESYRAVIYGSPLVFFGASASKASGVTTLHFLVNEVFMALFFGIAAKEITEACLPGGALSPLRRALNPLAATLGGVLGPVAVYKAMVVALAAPEIARGWGIPTATDIALAWLVARAVFGSRHAAVSYLLLLAVADDAIGLGIITVFYPDPAAPTQAGWLALVAVGMGLAWIMKRRGVVSPWPYVLGPGGLCWTGLALGHLHPALALVFVVPWMPHAVRDEGLFAEFEGEGDVTDTMRRFEHTFKPAVDFGMFGFGLANAGVPLASVGPATWAVAVSLIVGKTLGVTSFSWLADRLGAPLPPGLPRRLVPLVGLVAALGLTVALFVAGAAFTEPSLRAAAKMGALLSVVAAPVALVWARWSGLARQEE